MPDSGQNGVIFTNVQHFSLHDGPGIRTTVFLKGCTIRCPWCSNPENLKFKLETYVRNGEKDIYGRKISCDELYKELIKDKAFYGEANGDIPANDFCIDNAFDLGKLPGGITFSGGEALAQIDRIVPLLEKLKKEHIHIAIETSLFVSSELLEIALNYIDLFYVDGKILNKEKCRAVLCGDLELYFRNLDMLFSWKNETGHKKPVVIRIPVISGFTDIDANRKAVVELVRKYKPLKVELIKEHTLGASKYESLGMKVPDYKGVDDDLMIKYKAEIETTGVPAEVCKI